MSNQLTFNSINLATVNKNNQIWLSSSELAKALDYADTRSVTKIYSQHSDEFTTSMTEVVESTTSGNLKVSTRYFSLRGCHLIAMFSRTKIAKEFRKWVLDILDKQVGIISSITTEQKYQIRKAVNERSYRTGEHRQTIYHKLYDQFKINSYENLPANKFDDAIDFLGGVNQIKDNYDVLVKQLNHLEIIYDCQQKLLRIYLNDFQDFLEKISPSSNYNISTLLNKMQVNIGLALNYASTAHPTRIVTTQKQLTN